MKRLTVLVIISLRFAHNVSSRAKQNHVPHL